MAAGRKRKPPQLRVLQGNAGKRPIEHGPKVEIAAPKCPVWLPKEAKAEWKFITAELERYGLVSKLDRAALSVYCTSVALLEMAERKLKEPGGHVDETPNGLLQQSVWMQIRNKAVDQIMKTAPEFGLTPAARSRVDVKAPEQTDFFDQL